MSMGKRGPKPTPTPILKLRGSWRGKVRDELDMGHEAPEMPEWLSGEAEKCWDRLCPLLHRAGLATEANRETLAMVCIAYADFVEADQQFSKMRMKDGGRAFVVKTKAGGWKQNPLLHVRERAWSQFLKGAACFGLTPADLASVRAVEKPTTDEKAKFFKGAG